MIFQRGNPMDYERWAADPGMKEWDYAHCLPYFKRMETCLRGRRRRLARRRRPAGPRARPGDQPAVRRVLRGRPAGRLPADRRRQRLPPGGVRAVRPQRPPRPPALRRSRLPAPGQAPQEPHVETLAIATEVRFEGTRAVGVDYRAAAACTAPSTAGEVILCGGAINTPQLLQLSGVGDEELLEQPGHRRRPPPARAWARTSRTTSRSTSSTPPSSRSRSRPA